MGKDRPIFSARDSFSGFLDSPSGFLDSQGKTWELSFPHRKTAFAEQVFFAK